MVPTQPIEYFLNRFYKWFFALYILGFVGLFPVMRRQQSIQRQIEDARLGIIKISSELPDDLESKLIALNLKYQDRYYFETGLQANKSFIASLVVAILGFVMVCVAIVLFLYEQIPAASVTVAAGALTELISALFFYLFNKTVLSMASYHQRLLFTQNIALFAQTCSVFTRGQKATAHRTDRRRIDARFELTPCRHPD